MGFRDRMVCPVSNYHCGKYICYDFVFKWQDRTFCSYSILVESVLQHHIYAFAIWTKKQCIGNDRHISRTGYYHLGHDSNMAGLQNSFCGFHTLSYLGSCCDGASNVHCGQ